MRQVLSAQSRRLIQYNYVVNAIENREKLARFSDCFQRDWPSTQTAHRNRQSLLQWVTADGRSSRRRLFNDRIYQQLPTAAGCATSQMKQSTSECTPRTSRSESVTSPPARSEIMNASGQRQPRRPPWTQPRLGHASSFRLQRLNGRKARIIMLMSVDAFNGHA